MADNALLPTPSLSPSPRKSSATPFSPTPSPTKPSNPPLFIDPTLLLLTSKSPSPTLTPPPPTPPPPSPPSSNAAPAPAWTTSAHVDLIPPVLSPNCKRKWKVFASHAARLASGSSSGSSASGGDGTASGSGEEGVAKKKRPMARRPRSGSGRENPVEVGGGGEGTVPLFNDGLVRRFRLGAELGREDDAVVGGAMGGKDVKGKGRARAAPRRRVIQKEEDESSYAPSSASFDDEEDGDEGVSVDSGNYLRKSDVIGIIPDPTTKDPYWLATVRTTIRRTFSASQQIPIHYYERTAMPPSLKSHLLSTGQLQKGQVVFKKWGQPTSVEVKSLLDLGRAGDYGIESFDWEEGDVFWVWEGGCEVFRGGDSGGGKRSREDEEEDYVPEEDLFKASTSKSHSSAHETSVSEN
ncbi:hypothetical protein HDV00_007681 [Rhizophlyctis rosea]|nr:hypothetical protein HDV00_007681 [Rhizophlyctis rosea]